LREGFDMINNDLFWCRAQRLEDGQTVYGNVHFSNNGELAYITNPNPPAEDAWAFCYEVDPKSICRTTGRKVGDRIICEGDVWQYYNRIGMIIYDIDSCSFVMHSPYDDHKVVLAKYVVNDENFKFMSHIQDDPVLLDVLHGKKQN